MAQAINRTESKLFQAHAVIRAYGDHLENMVSQRTEKLERANRELQRINRELRKLTELKDEFVGIVSHDLKSPFTSILGFSEFLLQDKEHPLDARQRTFVSRIKASAQDLLTLIQDLLNIASLENGKISIEPKIVKPRPLFDRCFERLSFSFIQKNIALQNDVPGDLALFVDEIWVAEMLMNLLTNSVKFTKVNGCVAIGVDALDGGFVRFVVEDNGVGVEPSLLPYLFDKHRKTSTKGTDGESGTGLGLPLCRQIVELHGGDIWIESDVGRGTRVSFTLPLAGQSPDPRN